jgi:hypothetical protein
MEAATYMAKTGKEAEWMEPEIPPSAAQNATMRKIQPKTFGRKSMTKTRKKPRDHKNLPSPKNDEEKTAHGWEGISPAKPLSHLVQHVTDQSREKCLVCAEKTNN